MIEQLVSKIFALRDESHLAHWKTRSYAQHKALDELYNGLVEHIDGIVEAYQGCYGLIGDIPQGQQSREGILECLTETANWIAANREKIADNNTVLENLIDGLGDLMATTAYKLRFLS